MLIAFFVLAVYLFSAQAAFYGGDSGEYMLLFETGGVAHPPGYPLFIALGSIFTELTGLSGKVSSLLFSSITSSLSAYFVYSIVSYAHNRLEPVRKPAVQVGNSGLLAGICWSAVVPACLYAFSPLIFRFSIVPEVFSFNCFFLSLVLYLLIRFDGEKKILWAYLAWFSLILGLGNHHTLAIPCLPAFILVLYRNYQQLLRLRVLGVMLLLLVIGLTPYLYLFYAADNLFSWGETGTLEGFFHHFLRKDYGTFQLYSGEEQGNFLQNLYAWLTHSLQSGFIVAPLFALYGAWRGVRDKIWPVIIVTICLSFYILVFEGLSNLPLSHFLHYEIHSRFWMISDLMMFILAGAGWVIFLKKYESQSDGRALKVAGGALVIFAVVNAVAVNHNKNSPLIDDLVYKLAETFKEDSIVFLSGDIFHNTFRYLQKVEGKRKDLVILDYNLIKGKWSRKKKNILYPSINLPEELPKDYGEFFGRHVDTHDMYLCNIKKKDYTWESSYKIFFCDYIPKGNRKLEKEEVFKLYDEFWKDFSFPYDEYKIRRPWERVLYEWYQITKYKSSVFVLKQLEKEDKEMLRTVIQNMESVNRDDNYDYGELYQNLAGAWQKYDRNSLQGIRKVIYYLEKFKKKEGKLPGQYETLLYNLKVKADLAAFKKVK